MNKYDIVLAGLLHDIGKFFEKANNKGQSIAGIEVVSGVDHGHGVTSANFINHFSDKISKAGFDVEAVATMAQRHHELRGKGPASVEDAPIEYRPYCYIIDKADTLSSSERLSFSKGEGNQAYQLRRITNVFSLLAGKRYSQEAGVYTQVYGKVSSDSSLNNVATNKAMVESFVDEFSKIDVTMDTVVNSQRVFIGKVNQLLKKYTWCYPSDTTEYIRDISLYSHLQTTAAIAGVLYDDLTTNPEYKRGLGSDKERIGWQFTEVSIKDLRTQRVELIKIHLANAMDIVTSAGVADIPKVRAWLMKCKVDLNKAVYEDLGITAVNNICSDDYSSLFIVQNGAAARVVDIVKSFNRTLPQIVGKPLVFFEAAYSKLDLDEMASNDTGEIISKLNNTMDMQWENSHDGTKYFGLSSLMVSDDGKWGSVGIENIGTVSNFSSYGALKKSQEEIVAKLNSKLFAIVKVRVDNYGEVVPKLMSMTFKESNSIINNDAKDKRVGTICRLSALMDQVNKMIGLELKDCIYLYKGQDGLVFITTLDNAFKAGAGHQRIISKQSAGVLKTSLFVETVYSRDIDLAFNHMNQIASSLDKPGVTCYTGLELTEAQFNRIPNFVSMVTEAGSLKSGKGNLYKLLEFIGMYEDYCKTGDVHKLMCIPRFKYNATRNFNKDSITPELEALITEEFSKLTKVVNPSKADTDLFLIKQIIYDTLQTLKISSEVTE